MQGTLIPPSKLIQQVDFSLTRWVLVIEKEVRYSIPDFSASADRSSGYLSDSCSSGVPYKVTRWTWYIAHGKDAILRVLVTALGA